MSETALAEYNEARITQTTQNDARRIRTRVEAALQNPTRASVRWPFELMQNAHDAGPRDGDDRVEINFILQEGKLGASHTGKPFTPQELAALLSGGSSKEFDDEETTGRFGTGFLVTHGLSPFVHVDGVLSTLESREHFHVELVRDGDEDSIVQNIELANQSLASAETASETWIAENPTVSFTYRGVDCNVAIRGLDRLQQALPYLYATCEKLGRVCIELPDRTVVYEPGATTECELGVFTLRSTEVAISDPGGTKHLNAVRVGEKDGRSGLLTIIETCDNQKRLKLPDAEFPKLFVKFPIAGTGFLPFNVVLDGQFTPQQERDGILMNESDKQLIFSSMSSLPSLVRHAVESGWINAHKLAQLAIPGRTFSDESGSGESEWWQDIVSRTAKATAAEPIIETSAGRLPALHQEGVDAASFLVSSISASESDSFEYESIHELAIAVDGLYVPNLDVAHDWGEIAGNWRDADVAVERLGFAELADWVKMGSSGVKDLPIPQKPFTWLASFLNLAGELSDTWAMDEAVNGLVPNQLSELSQLSELRIDASISEEVKDIADAINYDLRSRLLHTDLSRELAKPEYEAAKSLLDKSLGEYYRESEAFDKILDQLDNSLSEGKKFDEDVDILRLRAAGRLAVLLCEEDDMPRLRRCPMLAANDTIVRLANNLQILAPVSYWPKSAHPYAGLYTTNRVLSSFYFDDSELKEALGSLIGARLVIPAPLYEATRPEIDEANLLNAMSAGDQNAANVTVRNASFGQIAFLPTELVNRCGHDPNLARLLLEFVLDVAAREDQSWRRVMPVNANRAGERIQLSLRGATWPYELKVRSWVPVPLSEEPEGEGYAPAPANEANLRGLYEPSLLRDNAGAVDLLHEVFGFRQLTLMLDSLDSEVESDLVELLRDPGLVESAVRNRELLKSADENPDAVKLISEASPEEIQKIREELEERERQAERREYNRRFGHAAQEALAEAIESHGLDLVLVDRGFDYEVFPGPLDGSLEEASFSFEVGSYFLEVKATTSGDVRLTPLQAQTASDSPDRFVLCVIDLRGQEMQQSWNPSDVEPFAKILTDIGSDVVEVYEGVDAFSSAGIPVRLRNEQQLRYGISTGLWERGVSIGEWVQSLKTD